MNGQPPLRHFENPEESFQGAPSNYSTLPPVLAKLPHKARAVVLKKAAEHYSVRNWILLARSPILTTRIVYHFPEKNITEESSNQVSETTFLDSPLPPPAVTVRPQESLVHTILGSGQGDLLTGCCSPSYPRSNSCIIIRDRIKM